MPELARQVFGLPVPEEGALFDVALALHIAAGLTCVVTGALAATAPKRPGRHTGSGDVFLWSLAVVFASSTTMAVLRLAQDWHLLVIGAVAFGAGCLGYLARRRGRPGWLRVHIPAMGGAYIALFMFIGATFARSSSVSAYRCAMAWNSPAMARKASTIAGSNCVPRPATMRSAARRS